METLRRAARVFNSLPNSVKAGAPFIVFIIMGSFGLKEFTQLRYTFRKQKGLDPEELKALGITLKPTPTLDEVYEEIKTLDLDDWENIRGPRPYEEGSEEILEQMKAKAKARRKQKEEAAMQKIRDA